MGKAFKDKLWGVTQAVNIYAFDDHIQKVFTIDKRAHAYLSGVSKAS
jgi:hypothetical protein